MKRLMIGIGLVLAAGGMSAQTYTKITNALPVVTLAWDKSTDATVTGYNVYWGTQSRAYATVAPAGTATNINVTLPARGVTYYFAATSLAAGTVGTLESDFSGEATYTPRLPPTPPNLKPPVTLMVQSKSAVADKLWADTEMSWPLDATKQKEFFRLRIVSVDGVPVEAGATPTAVTIEQPQPHAKALKALHKALGQAS